MTNMDFDQILEEIGEFGRYQKTNYLLICLPVMFAAANSLSYVFTAGTPSYRCLIPECEETAEATLRQPWLVNAAPGSTDKNGVFTPEPCYRYGVNTTTYISVAENGNRTDSTEEGTCPKELFTQRQERCFEWVFDPQERTIVQEWHLTCKENAWRLAFVGTMHFAGLVVGTASSGYLADRFGRKNIFIICIIFMAITGIAQGLAWDYNSFLIFAFLNAVGTSGVYPLAFIIGVEMVGPRRREMSSNVLNYFYAIGEAIVGLSAWLMHDWQLLQFALSVPPLFFIAYYWIVPESVRWLIAKDKRQKAGDIIKKAAQVNKRDLSNALLSSFQETNTTAAAAPDTGLAGQKGRTKVDTNSTCNLDDDLSTKDKNEIWSAVKEVFKSKTLVLRYTILLYVWAINAIVFYGLSLNATSLGGNKYINFSLVCIIEIPGYTLAWISLRKFGRRLALSGSLLLCAITCFLGGYITKGTTWAIVLLFLIGKLGVTSSFAVVYTYTAEMMPTVIRSGGVGVMSTFARFGAMLAPFVPLLGTYYEALPLLLFGALSLSGAFMGIFLPETFHKKLPDTVQDAKRLGKNDEKKKTAVQINDDRVEHGTFTKTDN